MLLVSPVVTYRTAKINQLPELSGLQERVRYGFDGFVRAVDRNTKERYLNLMILLMRGNCTKERLGRIPRSSLKSLTARKRIEYFETNDKVFGELKAQVLAMSVEQLQYPVSFSMDGR
ncbi:MAG: hypothetical protein HGA80_07645 [Candidatus Omnitrophica bacterium]|nr:hypothetical protein [Candidatus Omnitrophota bacterium]